MTAPIRWTESERETVYRGMLRASKELKTGLHKLSTDDMVKVLTQGQIYLALDRRRIISRNNAARDFGVIINRFMTPEEIQATDPKLIAMQPKPNSVIKPGPTIRSSDFQRPLKKVHAQPPKVATEPEPQQKEELPDTFSAMLSGAIDTFVAAFEEKMANRIADRVTELVLDRLSAKQAPTQQEPAKSKKKLPRILVCGPLKKQQSQLITAVKGVAELRFVASDENSGLVPTRANACDGAVVWTSFIDHSMQTAAKKSLTGKTVKLVAGGLKQLQDEIESIALQLSE